MTGIEVAVVVGLGLLAKGCDSSSDEETLEPSSDGPTGRPEVDMGMSGEPEVPEDARTSSDTLQPPPDVFVAPDEGVPPRPLRPDVNIASGDRLAIFAGRFGEPEGILYSYDLTDPSATPAEEDRIPSTDVILRYQGENLFALDRTGGSIYVYNDRFDWLNTIPVDAGSNPQDIVVLPEEDKAYVTRLDAQNGTTNSDDLWVLSFSPTTGEAALMESLSFTPYTTDDGDRLARAAQMVLVGADLYVAVQDLSGAFSADTNGKVLVIDTTTDEVTSDIQLAGRNPADITYSEINDRVYVTNTGRYESDYTINLNTDFGGIEVINPDKSVSEGILLDDAVLQGAVSEIRLASGELGYVMTDFVSITPFHPQEMRELDTEEIYVSDYFFLPDFSLDLLRGGRRVIADENIVIPPADPIALESSATSIAFVP